MKSEKPDTKKVFWNLGTCSRTFFFLLNREFGHLKETGEHAADPLAGGIMGRGHQCGMVWGATLAVGAESFRRYNGHDMATAAAMSATQSIVESFVQHTGSVNCRDVTGADFSNPFSMIKYILFKARSCFDLAEKWAPEAVQSAVDGLSTEKNTVQGKCLSCASETARKMGASDEEAAMVAGFAGGVGLSGNACGALGAAVWMKTLELCRGLDNPKKMVYKNREAKNVFEAFLNVTDSRVLCREICGRDFQTLDEHTNFIQKGGCEKLIQAVARI